MSEYIAVDIGAESGRVITGAIDDGMLSLRECRRFANGPVEMRGRLHWNIAGIYEEIIRGLASVTDSSGNSAHDAVPESIGIDTWGVDFCLLAEDGSLLGLPVAYRDSYTDGMIGKFCERVPAGEIYSRTGIQFMQFNTIYQLFAMAQQKSPQLEAASDLLLIPDFLNYLLTGRRTNEFTNATTTQLFNVNEGGWDSYLLEATGARPSIMQEIIQPGSIVGELDGDAATRSGLAGSLVIAPATHDTGSAVAAVPAEGKDWAFISSGTWSLMGVELDAPDNSHAAMDHNFTNEGGVFGTWRFLKNIMGLWILQRCRTEYDREYSYPELMSLAGAAQPFRSLIDVDQPQFLNPASMTAEIRAYCNRTKQPSPKTPGEFTCCALESLALKYRLTLDEIKNVRNMDINQIHVIGGGSQNELLCSMTANAAGIPVQAGPAESTAAGNIIVQAAALGHINTHAEARRIIMRSFEIRTYEPEAHNAWEDALGRFIEIRGKTI